MMDVGRVRGLRAENGLWVVEDAAHAFPAAWRPDRDERVAAVRREHVRDQLLLLLRQQDDHDGRRRNGDDGRRRARGTGCA